MFSCECAFPATLQNNSNNNNRSHDITLCPFFPHRLLQIFQTFKRKFSPSFFLFNGRVFLCSISNCPSTSFSIWTFTRLYICTVQLYNKTNTFFPFRTMLSSTGNVYEFRVVITTFSLIMSMHLNTKQRVSYTENLWEYYLETRIRNQNRIDEENMG